AETLPCPINKFRGQRQLALVNQFHFSSGFVSLMVSCSSMSGRRNKYGLRWFTCMKKLPIGISDFQKIILDDYFYVDKTLLIDELWRASGEVILMPRPRRF